MTPPQIEEAGTAPPALNVTLQRPSARKSSRALAIIRAISKAVPGLQNELADFRRDYGKRNVVELDRVQARLEFRPRPFVIDGQPVYEPAEINGEPNPRAGELVLTPSPIDHMTEDDWAAAGGVLKLERDPAPQEMIAALLDTALELAEAHVFRLLALFTMTNDEVAKSWKDGTFNADLDEKADELLDNYAGDEILELAVLVGELVDTTFVRKAKSLGGRLGNLAKLVGMGSTSDEPTVSPTPTMTVTPAPSTSTSSTDSPEPTAGDRTPSSTPTGDSSTDSSSESDVTTSSSEPTKPLEPQEATA